MQYDFTSILDRHGKDALAVDLSEGWGPKPPQEGFDLIPMWVADMNFPTVPTVPQALAARAAHPAYGYFELPPAYYQAIIDWQRTRNGVQGLTSGEIGYENGVLGCVASAVTAFTGPGDGVLVHSPTYIGFDHVLEDTGRKMILSPLKQDENGVWRMDYEDMDRKLRENHIHLAIFCSPHNPCGRVWTPGEIAAAMEVYRKNEVIVISDEIWSDLILTGYHHTPTQSVSEDARARTIAIYAPSKTFNLAGLVGSYHIIYDPLLRDRVRAQAQKTHYNGLNVLSTHALIAAYSAEGADWLEQLREVLTGNIDYALDYIRQHFDGVTTTRPEGTYMLYLDCSGWCQAHGKPLDELLEAGWQVGVAWQDGRPFQYPDTIRLNLALPLSRVQEAFERLSRYVFTEGEN